MKKPNITKGVWRVSMESISFTTVQSDADEKHHRDYLCKVDDGLNRDLNERQANAKAISAVPEMIDALIDVFEWMNCLDKGTHSINEIQKWVEEGRNPHIKIEQALKKAGVQI